MARETVNGVVNFYGPRHRHEALQGQMPSAGAMKEMVLLVSGDTYDDVSAVLPAGAVITGHTVVEVEEAFALGGTTPTINIGTSGSHGTNYVAELSEAQAEAIGTYSLASAGTLAVNTPLAAATTIVVGLDGTTPTITGVGKMKVVIQYRVI